MISLITKACTFMTMNLDSFNYVWLSYVKECITSLN